MWFSVNSEMRQKQWNQDRTVLVMKFFQGAKHSPLEIISFLGFISAEIYFYLWNGSRSLFVPLFNSCSLQDKELADCGHLLKSVLWKFGGLWNLKSRNPWCKGRRPSGGQEDRKGGRMLWSNVGYSEIIQTIGKAMGTFPFFNDFFYGLLL